MKEIREEIIKLNNRLIEASEAYYNGSEIISNYEYDLLYDKLSDLQNKSGFTPSNSVTMNVGAKIVAGSFATVKHEQKMLSLNKTKSPEELKRFLGVRDCCLSWKLDGITVVLTYENGVLVQAATRGDGEVGDDITQQARMFSNIPLKIPYNEKLVVRGEALISYEEFSRINKVEGQDFKNPRNLVSGTVKTLDTSVLNKRMVSFVAFTLVSSDKKFKEYDKQLEFLDYLGFEVVEHVVTDSRSLDIFIDLFTKASENYDYPVDGLVLYYNELSAHYNAGVTSHHPNYAIAYKWSDKTKNTVLKDIEWHKSRTGRINPVAIFEPVEIDGTIVERASLHNIDYISHLKLNIGDRITVYKANMIIPQIAENLDKSLKSVDDILPKYCPACGGKVTVESDGSGSASFLMCANPHCSKSAEIVHFLKALKVKGLSETTVNKLIDNGIIKDKMDLFNLEANKDEILSIDGIGERKLEDIINKMSNIRVLKEELLSSFGIDGVGKEMASTLLDRKSIEELSSFSISELQEIDGVGYTLANNIRDFFEDEDSISMMKALEGKIEIIDNTPKSDKLGGKSFAVTGKLYRFSNRKELQDFIASNGGVNTSSVTKNTDYLITNDTDSESSKNKKAKELGVTVITEEELLLLVN